MPAGAIPNWITGRTVTAFTLTPQTVTSAGVPSDTTPVATMAGIWDEVDIELETETEEISAADGLVQNMVLLKDLWRIRLVQILKAGAANPLATAWGTGIHKLMLTRGTSTWTLYVVRTGYTENIRKGKSVGIFTAACVDNGLAGYS